MRKKNRMTLANLCGGEVQQMVDRALDAVGKNIADPNMDPKKVREVNIKIKLAPKEDDPEDVKVSVSVTKTLAAEQPIKTDFYVNTYYEYTYNLKNYLLCITLDSLLC